VEACTALPISLAGFEGKGGHGRDKGGGEGSAPYHSFVDPPLCEPACPGAVDDSGTPTL